MSIPQCGVANHEHFGEFVTILRELLSVELSGRRDVGQRKIEEELLDEHPRLLRRAQKLLKELE